jgi:hypothetical protein
LAGGHFSTVTFLCNVFFKRFPRSCIPEPWTEAIRDTNQERAATTQSNLYYRVKLKIVLSCCFASCAAAAPGLLQLATLPVLRACELVDELVELTGEFWQVWRRASSSVARKFLILMKLNWKIVESNDFSAAHCSTTAFRLQWASSSVLALSSTAMTNDFRAVLAVLCGCKF